MAMKLRTSRSFLGALDRLSPGGGQLAFGKTRSMTSTAMSSLNSGTESRMSRKFSSPVVIGKTRSLSQADILRSESQKTDNSSKQTTSGASKQTAGDSSPAKSVKADDGAEEDAAPKVKDTSDGGARVHRALFGSVLAVTQNVASESKETAEEGAGN